MASPLLSERVSALEARVDRLETLLIAFRDETRQRFDAIDQRFEAIDQRFEAINQRLDDTNRRIGVLHEDVITRIATLGEQLNGRGRKRRKST
jgi:tetrahydromethanopterin S-methyltransferase subunit G